MSQFQARCDNYEKQLSDLLQSLSLYTRRTAKLRDSGDCVSDAFSTLAASEAVNPTFKRATVELSKTIRSIQDHRDSEVLYFEEKLLSSLAQYGESLQKQKERIRTAVPKVIDADKNRNSIWINTSQASTSQNRRRSQSADRAERISKEERELQKQVQQYEFHKNLVLKKLMLRFLLTELRLTIKSFNNLTMTYQNVLRDFSPPQDLKAFNEFFNFRTIKKSMLNEIQDAVSDFDSQNDDDEDDDDDDDVDGNDEQHESGLEENQNSADDVTETPEDDDDNSESWKSESASSSTQSTLRRFNSTPEMDMQARHSNKAIQKDVNIVNNKKELSPFSKNNNSTKSTNEKVSIKNQLKKRTNKQSQSDEDEVGSVEEDEDEESDDEQRQRQQKQKNKNRRPNTSRPSSVRSIRKQFK